MKSIPSRDAAVIKKNRQQARERAAHDEEVQLCAAFQQAFPELTRGEAMRLAAEKLGRLNKES